MHVNPLGKSIDKTQPVGYFEEAKLMAEAHRERGFTFHVFSNDHQPAHVHALKAGGEIKIDVSGECADLLEIKRKMGRKDIKRALEIADIQLEKLKEKWREIHEQRN